MAHQHTPSTTGPQGGSGNGVDAEAVTKGYEPHDIGLRFIFIFIGGLVVVMVVVLAFIWAVMQAVAGYYRSDSIASPVETKLPAIYAPLQPSLGFYGEHSQDHDKLDFQDMTEMRAVTAKELEKNMTIDAAIDKALPNIVSKPVTPVPAVVYPDDTFEGKSTVPKQEESKQVHTNEMNDLNDWSW